MPRRSLQQLITIVSVVLNYHQCTVSDCELTRACVLIGVALQMVTGTVESQLADWERPNWSMDVSEVTSFKLICWKQQLACTHDAQITAGDSWPLSPPWPSTLCSTAAAAAGPTAASGTAFQPVLSSGHAATSSSRSGSSFQQCWLAVPSQPTQPTGRASSRTMMNPAVAPALLLHDSPSLHWLHTSSIVSSLTFGKHNNTSGPLLHGPLWP
jgi:hypothetical protein